MTIKYLIECFDCGSLSVNTEKVCISCKKSDNINAEDLGEDPSMDTIKKAFEEKTEKYQQGMIKPTDMKIPI